MLCAAFVTAALVPGFRVPPSSCSPQSARRCSPQRACQFDVNAALTDLNAAVLAEDYAEATRLCVAAQTPETWPRADRRRALCCTGRMRLRKPHRRPPQRPRGRKPCPCGCSSVWSSSACASPPPSSPPPCGRPPTRCCARRPARARRSPSCACCSRAATSNCRCALSRPPQTRTPQRRPRPYPALSPTSTSTQRRSEATLRAVTTSTLSPTEAMEVLAPALSTLDGGGPAAGGAKDPFFGMRLRGAPPAIVLVPDGDALLAEQAHSAPPCARTPLPA